MTTCLLFLQCSGSANTAAGAGNVIANPGFLAGLPTGWTSFGTCTITVSSDASYILVTGRQQTYAGPAWDVTSLLTAGTGYTAQVSVQLATGSSAVKLTMIRTVGGQVNFDPIGSGQASGGCWTAVGGTYTLSGAADSLVMYLEGAPVGTDVYVQLATLSPTAVAATPAATPAPAGAAPSNLVSEHSCRPVQKTALPNLTVLLFRTVPGNQFREHPPIGLLSYTDVCSMTDISVQPEASNRNSPFRMQEDITG